MEENPNNKFSDDKLKRNKQFLSVFLLTRNIKVEKY